VFKTAVMQVAADRTTLYLPVPPPFLAPPLCCIVPISRLGNVCY